jgi:hypothetical protein
MSNATSLVVTTANHQPPSPQPQVLACDSDISHWKGVCQIKRQIPMAALLLSVVALLPNMSFAHNTAAGCDDKKSPVTLRDTGSWIKLCKKQVDLTDGTHTCIATGAAKVENTVGDTHNEYRFTLSTDNNPKGTELPGEQRIDVNQSGGVDLAVQSVSAVQHFGNLAPGTYTFYWMARPLDSSADNIDVTRFAMGVVCTDGK